MADGGEGTAEILAAALSPDAEFHPVDTVDAIGRPTSAGWWRTSPGRAVLDLASASGLPAVADAPDAMGASTYGTGEVILDALAHGCDDITLCLGGSATTDGGAGLVSALGARVLDAEGRRLPGGGGALPAAASVDWSALDPRARRARWTLVLDVTTPPRDAAAVFGPQKGASPDQVRALSAALSTWCRVCGIDDGAPGYGAAGATPVGIAALVRAAGATSPARLRIERGAGLVARASGLDEVLRAGAADLVLTGEGSIDGQSHAGKVVGWIVDRAAVAGPSPVPVHLIGGRIAGRDGVVTRAAGATALPGPMTGTLAQLRDAAREATLAHRP